MGTITRRGGRRLLLLLLSVTVGAISSWSALGLADVLTVDEAR